MTKDQDLASALAQLKQREEEIRLLNQVGQRLASEKDVDSLLPIILETLRKLTNSDSGSFFLYQDGDPPHLIFKVSQSDTYPVDFTEFPLPLDNSSLAGHSAVSRQMLNFSDVYEIQEDSPYKFNKEYDKLSGYRTRSMLVLPLFASDDRLLGVIQLINRVKTPGTILSNEEIVLKETIPYDKEMESFIQNVAAQAGLALENSLLIDQVENLFEGFISASVQAIEQRDPTTSGHSQRVADMTVAIAAAVNEIGTGRFKDHHYDVRGLQEIHYAGLLHDFGKIGVKEEVLVKAEKLYPREWQSFSERVRLLRSEIRLKHHREMIRILKEGTDPVALALVEEQLARDLKQVDDLYTQVEKAKNPTVLEEGTFEALRAWCSQVMTDSDGQQLPWLTYQEFEALSIRRGSLTQEERREIESHVTHTFNFLVRIPWTKWLKDVPLIAHAHHEKLSGEGYPLGLAASEIPLQARMMTIADIFDALTASDRPYKKAVTVDKAVEILGYEEKDGNVDSDLLALFREKRLWEVVHPSP